MECRYRRFLPLGLATAIPELGAHSLRPPTERLLLRSVRLKRARRLDLDHLLLPPLLHDEIWPASLDQVNPGTSAITR
jgi:hypothetical protein